MKGFIIKPGMSREEVAKVAERCRNATFEEKVAAWESGDTTVPFSTEEWFKYKIASRIKGGGK